MKLSTYKWKTAKQKNIHTFVWLFYVIINICKLHSLLRLQNANNVEFLMRNISLQRNHTQMLQNCGFVKKGKFLQQYYLKKMGLCVFWTNLTISISYNYVLKLLLLRKFVSIIIFAEWMKSYCMQKRFYTSNLEVAFPGVQVYTIQLDKLTFFCRCSFMIITHVS